MQGKMRSIPAEVIFIWIMSNVKVTNPICLNASTMLRLIMITVITIGMSVFYAEAMIRAMPITSTGPVKVDIVQRNSKTANTKV